MARDKTNRPLCREARRNLDEKIMNARSAKTARFANGFRTGDHVQSAASRRARR
jgi:hypothetical protein